MSAVDDQTSDVVFAELAGAYWLDGPDWTCHGCGLVLSPPDAIGDSVGPRLADRLMAWRKLMMPVAVLTITVAIVMGTCR
ncbi:hypothetical protein [Streptomyces sp. H23]|uniref:hypothetical protein n=1 Tax=Streptomyces sp. H23 TaxID=2541723 RepID=UPI00106E0AB5|nr:hypothetical protein [Streptomyces sp. H23]